MVNTAKPEAGLRAWLSVATDRTVLRKAALTSLIVAGAFTAITLIADVAQGDWQRAIGLPTAMALVGCFVVSTVVIVAILGRPLQEVPRGTVLLEEQIERINRFPDQNPNPVMRMTSDGHLIYANPASAQLRAALGAQVGERLSPEAVANLTTCAADPAMPVLEIESDHRTFALLAVAVPEFGFVNLYGTDITAAKVVNKFPDANPNPVIRVTEEGKLLYRNRASEPLVAPLGWGLGDTLPADLFARMLRAIDDPHADPIEVQSDQRTFVLTPVRIPEFGFINVYGTDVTAMKWVNKFPDQNPNPVLRISKEGALLYANPASARIRSAHGMAVGQTIPPAIHREVLERLDSGATVEVEAEDRLFSLLPVWVHEFGFINLYGTDITAVREVEKAHRENERLLLNILPAPIAERLRSGETLIADRFDDVTLLFADIVGFTQLSSQMSAAEVVDVLNRVFSLFDDLVDRHGLEKIKTIGDAYMVVGGLDQSGDNHAARVATMALELSEAVDRLAASSPHKIMFRIGMHCGPAVAGVIGVRKFIYDVWGDTVNTASRMESHGVPGRVHVTQAVYERLKGAFEFESRGVIDVRGKGPMATYLLLRRVTPDAYGVQETAAPPRVGG